VATPGVGSTVHASLVTHAEANRRIALLSSDETDSIANVISDAAAVDSDFAGLFAPWVKINAATGPRFTSPEGYVAAVRNRAHSSDGPWRSPAGQIAAAKFVTGLKYDYTRAEGDELDAGKVSAIRVIANLPRLYGWRSLSNDVDNFSLLSARDILNYVTTKCEAALEEYVFQTIDAKGHLLSAVHGALVGVMQPIANANGVFAKYDANKEEVDPGYLVDTDSVNTIDNLALNEVRALVSLRPSPSAALISVTIVKVGLLSGL